MNILDLPTDVTLQIFSYLSPVDIAGRVRRTCTAWQNCSYDKSLWRIINLRKFGLHNKFSSMTFLEFLKGIAESIQSLDLGYTSLDSVAYYHEDIYCSNLKELYLFGCDISGDCIIKLFEKYRNLTSVSLSLKSTKTFCEILKQLQGLADLKKLAIHNSVEEYNQDVQELCSLFRKNVNIESLMLVHCNFPSFVYEVILETNTNLKELSIQFCGQIDRHIFGSCPSLKQLQKLSLTDTKFDDDVLKALVDRTSCLRYISIPGCGSFVTDTSISYMAEHCTFLTTLVLSQSRYDKSSITNVGLQAVSKCCHLLRDLVINYCSEVSDTGVTAIAQGCPDLEEFEVAGCTALSDASILCLVDSCRKLRKLNLKECVQLTSLSVNDVVTKLKHLKYLNLETCHRLTDLYLLKLVSSRSSGNRNGNSEARVQDDLVSKPTAQLHDTDNDHGDSLKNVINDLIGNPADEKQKEEVNLEIHSHLFSLYLGFCSKISASCIRQVATFCPDLRELTLQGCSYINDSSVAVLMKCCRFLSRLNISGGSVNQISRLTDKCLDFIGKHGENLRHLLICKNHNITISGLFSVITRCPKVCLVSASVGERTNVSVAGLSAVAGSLEKKLVRIKKFGETRVDIFVYVNRGQKSNPERT